MLKAMTIAYAGLLAKGLSNFINRFVEIDEKYKKLHVNVEMTLKIMSPVHFCL